MIGLDLECLGSGAGTADFHGLNPKTTLLIPLLWEMKKGQLETFQRGGAIDQPYNLGFVDFMNLAQYYYDNGLTLAARYA